MSTKTVLNVKTDVKLKKRAQRVAKELGLPLGTIINRYLQTLVVEQRVVFERPEIPNAKTAKILRQAHRDLLAGKNISPIFKTGEEAIAYLHSTKG